jgi:hypothetical protein
MIDAWFGRFKVSINLNIFYINSFSLLILIKKIHLQTLTATKFLNEIELITLLQGGFEISTLQLGKIRIKIKGFNPFIQLFSLTNR